MKVEKDKFDNLLGRLLKAKPLPEKKVRTPKKRSPKPVIGRDRGEFEANSGMMLDAWLHAEMQKLAGKSYLPADEPKTKNYQW